MPAAARGARIRVRRLTPRALRARPRALLWYTLVHSNQSNSESADSENYRVVNSAYELRIHACIRVSPFSEFSRPVRIQYCPSRLGAKPVRTPIERGLDLFLSTSSVCKNGRFNRHVPKFISLAFSLAFLIRTSCFLEHSYSSF